MTTTILLVRHADVHNPKLLFYGRLPRFGLSELGREQARFLADYLKDAPIAAFYSSPMLRARQTAAILAERHPGARIHRTVALNEVRTGWMGRRNEEIPGNINLYEPPHAPEDETIADVWARVSGLLELLARRHRGETVCCVSHGDPVVIAHAGYLGLPLSVASIRRDWYPQKCSVTTLRFPGPSVEYSDVIGELAPELKAPH